jgi:hypothetical protein
MAAGKSNGHFHRQNPVRRHYKVSQNRKIVSFLSMDDDYP